MEGYRAAGTKRNVQCPPQGSPTGVISGSPPCRLSLVSYTIPPSTPPRRYFTSWFAPRLIDVLDSFDSFRTQASCSNPWLGPPIFGFDPLVWPSQRLRHDPPHRRDTSVVDRILFMPHVEKGPPSELRTTKT